MPPDSPPARPPTGLDAATRRWLHDKYERLAANEGELAASRTSYFAAIGTVLITGLLVALNYFLADATLLLLVGLFLAALGLLISLVWAVLLHRTHDAQRLWLEAAKRLEADDPPVEGTLLAPVPLRSGETLEIDLLRPFTAHDRRFGPDHRLSWMDRVRPDRLTELLPAAFLVIWAVVLALVVLWAAGYR